MSMALDPVELTSGPIAPEQRLFVGVIVNAAQEAAGYIATRDRPTTTCGAQQAARLWFQEGGDDFDDVCELAGLEPREVRTRVLAYLDRVASDPAARVTVKRTNMGARQRGVSLHDVARRARVSPTTVSNVIHRRGHVAPPTRNSVLKAISELGYSRHVH